MTDKRTLDRVAKLARAQPDPLFFNGTHIELDPERAALTFDELYDLARRYYEFGEVRTMPAPPPRTITLTNTDTGKTLEINLDEYELCRSPYVPVGHYVLMRRDDDLLTMMMPTNKPDLIIFSPHEAGGLRAFFITQPRALADHGLLDSKAAEVDFFRLWRGSMYGTRGG